MDDRLMELVRSLDAEKATVSMSFNKDTWWSRRGRGTTRPFVIELEWGTDRDETRRFSGHAASLAEALDQVQAEVAGHLMKGALDA